MQPTQVTLPDADMALTDPRGYQEQLANYLNAQTDARVAAYAAPIMQNQAATALSLAKNDPKNAPIWQKYGAEIEAQVANIPLHLRTRELYDAAVTQVKGVHFDELATEKMAALAAANPGLARSDSGGAGDSGDGGSDLWDKIAASPLGKTTMDTLGKRGILNNVGPGKAYKSLEAYADAVSKTKTRVMEKSKQELYTRG